MTDWIVWSERYYRKISLHCILINVLVISIKKKGQKAQYTSIYYLYFHCIFIADPLRIRGKDSQLTLGERLSRPGSGFQSFPVLTHRSQYYSNNLSHIWAI